MLIQQLKTFFSTARSDFLHFHESANTVHVKMKTKLMTQPCPVAREGQTPVSLECVSAPKPLLTSD